MFVNCVITNTLSSTDFDTGNGITIVFFLYFSALAFERYIGIFKPLHYTQILTFNRCLVVLTLTWVYAMTFASLAVGQGTIFAEDIPCIVYVNATPTCRRAILIAILVTLAIISYVYLLILQVIKKQHQRTAALEYPLTEAQSEIQRHIHLSKTFLMVVGIFGACWLPLACLLEVSIHVSASDLDGPLLVLIQVLVYLNSAANPIVYALRMSAFRVAMKHIMLCYSHP